MKTIWMSCSTQKYNINCVDLRIWIEFQLRALSERKSLLRVESSLQDIRTCTMHVICSWSKVFFFAKMNNSLKKYCCFLQTCYFASKVFRSQVSLPYNLSFNFNFSIFKEGRRDDVPQNEYENNIFVIFNWFSVQDTHTHVQNTFCKRCAMLDPPSLLYIYPVMPCTVFMV